MTEAVERLRELCLAFPEAHEQVFGGHTIPTWRVNGKIFAQLEEHGDRLAAWCKGAPGAQEILVGSQPDRFFRPAYVGSKGWIGIWLDGDTDWDAVHGLIDESYRMTAPKRLLKGKP